jgi:hypothetical protein
MSICYTFYHPVYPTEDFTGITQLIGTMNYIGLRKEKFSREIACLFKTSRNLQMLFAAVTHLE